ncbi:WD repeat-containing protein 44 [Apophysomyces ossiformis]|uniref:WD repeat-containing protein 44 n=1 Tax=Apophysomyces ossiformis TaxID=679940 RepID=A0A8H7BUE7_9FUNG|nr:WD repeat-containing protein 44 [Apophysomyces ossiformis]
MSRNNQNEGMSSISVDNSQQDANVNKSTSSRNPIHGQPYVKMKSTIKIHKDFSRLILAQKLSTDDETSQSTSDSHQSHKAIWAMKFSTDGKHMAAGGQSCTVFVWNVTDHSNTVSNNNIHVFDENPIREYLGHKADILDLSWSKNHFLLSSSMDKTVRLWHVSRDECLCIFRHLDFVTSVAFHPKIRLWSIAEKRVAFWNEVSEGNMVTAVAFTLDGKTVCAGSHIGQCFFYDTQELKYNTQISIKDSGKKGRKITGIEPMPGMPPGEEKILITSNDSRIRMYNMKDKSLMFKYKGFENTSMQIKATFSDDGRYIICGSEDGNIYIWGTEQVNFSPFHYLQDSRIKAAAAIGNLGEQMMSTVMQGKDENGQPTRISGWLKRSEKHVQDKLRNRNEHFEAHDTAVAVAIFAPTETCQHLSRTNKDVIFSHTPIYIQSANQDTANMEDGSVHSNIYDYDETSDGKRTDRTSRSGQIMVSADNNGCIKVWRMDSGKYDACGNASNDQRLPNSSASLLRVEPVLSSKSESSRSGTSAPPSPRHRLLLGNLFNSQNRSKR